MPTADMHGGTVEFKDRDGREVGFELVRIGTLKEFETVKAALASTQKDADAKADCIGRLTEQATKTNEKLATADAAYLAEKEKNAEAVAAYSDVCERHGSALDAKARLTNEIRDLKGVILAERENGTELEAERGDLKGRFNELAKDHVARGGDLESARSELDQEQERRKDGDHDLEMARAELATTQERLDGAAEEYKKLHALVAGKDAELAKAETDYEDIATHVNNADAEVMRMRNVVKDKDAELEIRRDRIAASAERIADLEKDVAKHLAELCNLMTVKESLEETETALEVSQKELCESRAAAADLKAELLAEGNRSKTILDVMAEKIGGE